MSWRRALGQRYRVAAAGLVHGAWRAAQRAGAISVESAAGRRFAACGQHSLIAFPTGDMYGEAWIEVGDQAMIGAYVPLCAGLMPGDDLGESPVLRVGARCVIGRGRPLIAHP